MAELIDLGKSDYKLVSRGVEPAERRSRPRPGQKQPQDQHARQQPAPRAKTPERPAPTAAQTAEDKRHALMNRDNLNRGERIGLIIDTRV